MPVAEVLKLVLSDHWFEEIKSGRKTHEYRECKWFWINRLLNDRDDKEQLYRFVIDDSDFIDVPSQLNETSSISKRFIYQYDVVEFRKAYRKNAETMLFFIKKITIRNGKDTDLKIDKFVFDIELGRRLC